MSKRFRLWGMPDNSESWKLQQELGIDIINTDKIAECSDYFVQVKTTKKVTCN
ncbi:MAG TPA: hypothetical protein VFU29_18315 [Chitinophagaceae bacterium]|nr:hypothetical protein [Chitinophagaceae bacterium]